ncbi:MAG: hypothetical protein ACE5GO_12085, partial [Anaerolineales bacterium]
MKQDIINIWKNVQELDLRPIRELAEQDVRLALVGASGAGKRTLANQLCSDPERPDQRTLSPILLTDLELAEQAISADVIVLVVDVNISNVEREQALLDNWLAAGKRTIIFYNKIDLLLEEDAVLPWLETGRAPKIYGSALDRGFLQRELAPALMEALPDLHLALGRRFPLLREPAARNLIRQTCLANAAYSLGTGLAEIVPVLDIPLNIADVIVLTKAQALLVYKLGLTLGLSKDWPYYVGAFGSVI